MRTARRLKYDGELFVTENSINVVEKVISITKSATVTLTDDTDNTLPMKRKKERRVTDGDKI